MGYQFVMNVRMILINCNRNVNRTIVFLLIYDISPKIHELDV